MSGITPREAGQIVRAAKDKAEREIARSTLAPADVISVEDGGLTSSQIVTVHLDGDPSGETRPVANLGGVPVRPGGRCMVELTPPHGAVIRAGIGSSDAVPAVTITAFCGTGVEPTSNPQIVAAGDEDQVVFCCEQFTVGGAGDDIDGADTWVEAPTTGIYALHFQTDFTLDTPPAGGEFVSAVLRVYDATDTHVFDASYDQLGAEVGNLECSRACIPLRAGYRIRAFVTNATGSDASIGLVFQAIDLAWVTAGQPDYVDCTIPPT